MDARQPVTLKEGDRYPLRPPYKNTFVAGSLPVRNKGSHDPSRFESYPSVFLYGKVLQTMERQTPGNERPILVATEVQVLRSAPILFREIRAGCMDLTVNQWLGEFDPHTRSQTMEAWQSPVDCNSLENCRPFAGSVSSNLTASTKQAYTHS